MKYVNGNLIDLAEQGNFDIIIHGCNCFHNFGAGIAKEIKERYPGAYDSDKKSFKYGDPFKLGRLSHFDTGKFKIINAYTQYKWGRDLRLEALRECFKSIKLEYSGVKIGIPKIGAGYAGGDWKVISQIIDEELSGEDVTCVIIEE